MIVIYIPNQSGIQPVVINQENQALLKDALWIDLLSPTRAEEELVEKYLAVNIPTKEEMVEIELSSRLYKENSALFMTATMVAQSESTEPKIDAVTFILIEKQLITIRYIEPHSFKFFISHLNRLDIKEYKAEKILVGLLEATTDRLADILEKVSHKFDEISQMIFRPSESKQKSTRLNYQLLLQDIGANGDLGTKARESLVSCNRLVSFFDQTYYQKLDQDLQSRLKIIMNDINSLSDYAMFISSKVNFLLDATLGMVNIEQNNIIKIFSVAAVVFLPPTLIASIYGMNFEYMPELHWAVGYPIVIVLMILSAWLPYQYFKKKKWL